VRWERVSRKRTSFRGWEGKSFAISVRPRRKDRK
jgi:hypothetical protein